MTSEDVIHDFYIPAFRTKADVLPGKYTTEWFRPTKVGAYHIFCAEYCGTKHSGMIGTVYVMSAGRLQYVAGRGQRRRFHGGTGPVSVQSAGLRKLPCESGEQQNGRCPNLNGLFGTRVDLKDGIEREGG